MEHKTDHLFQDLKPPSARFGKSAARPPLQSAPTPSPLLTSEQVVLRRYTPSINSSVAIPDDLVAPYPVGGAAKRMMDLGIALPSVLVALPVMALIAGLILITTGRSPFFAHKRVGFRGYPFPCYKFQTMVPNAQEALAKLLASDRDAAREWANRRKLRHDPRVTRLGWILRKCSLDELPQLINVLKGDMSCIGPRPVTTEELERYGAGAGAYMSARPGITGLWQVTGRSNMDFPTRVSIDQGYVQNWSLLGDIRILAKTPAAVLRIMETG